MLDAESGKFEPRRWDEVRVGDIVEVRNRETFPADLLLLGALGPQGPSGHCWVSTKSLDGETDAKLREAPKATAQRIADEGQAAEGALLALRGRLRCEAPNNITSDFSGLLYLDVPPQDADGSVGSSRAGGGGGGRAAASPRGGGSSARGAAGPGAAGGGGRGSRGPASVVPVGGENDVTPISEVRAPRRAAGAGSGQRAGGRAEGGEGEEEEAARSAWVQGGAARGAGRCCRRVARESCRRTAERHSGMATWVWGAGWPRPAAPQPPQTQTQTRPHPNRHPPLRPIISGQHAAARLPAAQHAPHLRPGRNGGRADQDSIRPLLRAPSAT